MIMMCFLYTSIAEARRAALNYYYILLAALSNDIREYTIYQVSNCRIILDIFEKFIVEII